MGNRPSVFPVKPNNTINEPEPKPQIIVWPLPDNYIYPDMNEEIPILQQYCGTGNVNSSSDYHCRNLERVLFRNANHEKNKDRIFFNEATTGLIERGSLEKDTERDIGYHVKQLMERKQHPAVIAETCKDFLAMCDKYRNQNATSENQ